MSRVLGAYPVVWYEAKKPVKICAWHIELYRPVVHKQESAVMLAGSSSFVASELLRTTFDRDFLEIVDAHVKPKVSAPGRSETDPEQVLNRPSDRSRQKA